MSVKTITITEDAYGRLAARKNPGESFSEVIRKITGKHTLLDLVGVLSEREAATLEDSIKRRRRAMRERLSRTAREL